ncbi:hypothetical protein AC480_00620 [miscellaneous Crenarchaeota group archaeon SMTZ1-55]|nr:MAG: hypothetical protein AC480_00620 [miscellaneous Crenarchaeota group archaeon SMTZ1-55]
MTDSQSKGLIEAAKHYGSLFSLPSYLSIISFTIVICIIGGFSAFTITQTSVYNAFNGFLYGLLVLLAPTIIGDAVLSKIIFCDTAVLNKRRGAGLSLFVCITWAISLLVGAVFQVVLNNPSVLRGAVLFAVCLSIGLRFLVVSSVTYLNGWKAICTILLQPGLYFLSALVFFNLWHPLIIIAVIGATCVLLVFSYIFIRVIDKKGIQAVGIGAIPFFKAFVANWASGATEPIEDCFEKLGSNTNLIISLLAFKTNEDMKLVVVVPTIHPGPFHNVGSSNLPFYIEKALEEKTNAVIGVPHGTCNHKANLTSRLQCEKVLRVLAEASVFSNFKSTATRFVRYEQNRIKASCQIFGDVAFMTVTCAPANMEDIPLEVGLEIIDRSKKMGVKDVIVVDAHNSANNSKDLSTLSEDSLKDIIAVSEKVLNIAFDEEKRPFKIGVAKIHPEEFSIKDGVGPAGIVAFVVVVDDQKIAYIIIDGNNMVSGLREKALHELSDIISDGEIMTTDTHVVNAVVSIERGYYRVGEAVDEMKLIYYFRKCVTLALNNLGDAITTYRIEDIIDIKTIGEEVLKISALVDRTISLLKLLTPIIYVPAFIFAFIFFTIILFNVKI